MLVSLMRALKPKILDSFKDYNAQKEFLARINNKKNLTVFLNYGNSLEEIKKLQLNYNLFGNNQKNKKLVIYNYQERTKKNV